MSGKMTKQFKEAITKKLKSIEYPDWVKYIAADRNGEVWGFKLKPKLDSKKSIWVGEESLDSSNSVYLFKTDFDSTNWKNTLIALETIKIDITMKLEPGVRNIEGMNIVVSSQPKSVLKFKIWQPADTFLVYKIIEAKNIPDDTDYEYMSVDIEYDLLHPEKVTENYEGVEVFSSKEDRQEFIDSMLNKLHDLFYGEVRVKATENDIGKKVDTECGVADLINLTTDGKFVVMYNGESDLHICEKADVIKFPVGCGFWQINGDSVTQYEFTK